MAILPKYQDSAKSYDGALTYIRDIYTPICLSRLSTYGKVRLVLFRTSLGSFRENDLIGLELVCVKRRLCEPSLLRQLVERYDKEMVILHFFKLSVY